MALPQASLGGMPNMSLSGYIPAARNDPSVLEQALMAFLGGAAGTAGNRLVDKALPDPQRVASQKLAQDQLNAQIENNKAVVALGKDRNVTDNRGLTIQEQNAIKERQLREKLETERRLYDYFRNTESNALELNKLGVNDRNTNRGLDIQQKHTEAADSNALLNTQLNAVGTASGARVNNANADRLEAENEIGRQNSQASAAARAKAALGNVGKPKTEEGFAGKIVSFLQNEGNPIYHMVNPVVMGAQDLMYSSQSPVNDVSPDTAARMQAMGAGSMVPQNTTASNTTQPTPEELAEIMRRFGILDQTSQF